MAYNSLSELFKATADAIRSKTGGTEPIVANDFPAAIKSISGGGSGGVDTGVIAIPYRADGTYETHDSTDEMGCVLSKVADFDPVLLECSGLICVNPDAVSAAPDNPEIKHVYKAEIGSLANGIKTYGSNDGTVSPTLYLSDGTNTFWKIPPGLWAVADVFAYMFSENFKVAYYIFEKPTTEEVV